MDLTGGFDETRTRAAAERGLDYLCARAGAGHWRGFPTLAGESDVWVTGFVLAHVTAFIKRRRVTRAARDFLLSRRHADGGWSYGGEVPPDADSTAWCLMALEGSRQLSPGERRAGVAFLWSHATDEGVATYRADSGIRDYIRAPPEHSIDGWTSAHPDVTAAALLAGEPGGGRGEVLAGLVSGQRGTGFWDAYWWRGPHYTTALVLRLLALRRLRLSDDRARLLLGALRREQLADGGYSLGASTRLDPFTTALALESLSRLSYVGGKRERGVAASALLREQQPDGGWRGDYLLRLPAPDVTDPQRVSRWSREGGGGNSYVPDREGVFATALACHALDVWRRSESGEGVERGWQVVEPRHVEHEGEVLVAASQSL